MRKRIYNAIKSPIMSGGLIIFVGSLFGNVFNFLFNVYMSRNLSVADYGALASLVSFILLFALAAEALSPTVVSFSGSYFAKKEIGKVVSFFWKLNKLFVGFSLLVLLSFIVFSKPISTFLKIGNLSLLPLLGLIVIFTSVMTLNKGILTARLSFKYISFLTILSSTSKLLAGILLVSWGFGVFGGLISYLAAYVVYYSLSFIQITFIFSTKIKDVSVNFGKIISYAAPSALAMLGLILFMTTDILLVKHFYPSEEAGIYAGMSLLGKIIYFFSAPISTVLFPLVVQRHARNEKHSHLFSLAMLLVVLSSFSISLFYYLFPKLSIIMLLKQQEYLSVSSILWIFGLFMACYSILWTATNYYLSMGKTNIFIPIIFGAILQAISIWFYHDTFLTVIIISIISILITLGLITISNLNYFRKQNGK